MSSVAVNWIRLPDPPESMRSGVASNWNHDSFVIAPDCQSFQPNGVHRYSAITGKWDIAVKYPKIFWHLSVSDIATDPKNNKLFLRTDKQNDYLMAWRPKSKRLLGVFSKNGYKLSRSYSIVYIKGQLHFFSEKSHRIWNGKRGNAASFEMVANCAWKGFCMFIAVPSKGIILLIGGRNTMNRNAKDFEILKYSVESKKWSGTAIEFKYWGPSAMLTPSEKYIILSGGRRLEGYQFVQEIHVLDIGDDTNWNLYESNLRLSEDIDYHLAVTGGVEGDHLVIGWTRELFKKQEYLNVAFPPVYLLELIGKWLWCEKLHWIRRRPHYDDTKTKSSHWAIDLKHVLKRLDSVNT